MLEKRLRSLYHNSSQLSGTITWPPTLEVEYINLELVLQDRIIISERQKRIAKLSTQGEICGALKQSRPLALEDIFNYACPRKVIIIEGAPGIGKTTLAHKLCQEWANKKLLTNFSIVLYIPLRDRLVRLAESVEELLKYFEDCSPKLIKQNQGNGVLFILDGWDELPGSCRVSDSFFPKLIQGRVLSGCSILITSRPSAVDYDTRYHANRLIEILGFTPDQVMQYIQSYFKEYKGVAEKLTDDLHAYPNVASACYVAINLTILCYVYLESGFKLPLTLTKVYEQFIIHAIKRHLKRQISIDDPGKISMERLSSIQSASDFGDSINKIFEGLGKLALEGIEIGDLCFTRKVVASACSLDETEEFDGFGLLKVFGIEHNYQFLHLTVQEYLAGYTVFQMAEQEQGVWLAKNLRNEACEQVLKFFCGMDQFKSRPARVILKEFITAPFVLECVFEGQWEDACHKIAEEISSQLTISGRSYIHPYRALVYGYVITKSKSRWHLQWRDCVIGEHEIKSMNRHLLTMPTALTQISLIRCSLATKETVELFSKVIQSQAELSKLIITQTYLDDNSLNIIIKALQGHKKLLTLEISQNIISERSSKDIASLLATLPSLQLLDLSGSTLATDGYTNILQATSKSISLEKLYLPQKTGTHTLDVKVLSASRKEEGLNEVMICFQ